MELEMGTKIQYSVFFSHGQYVGGYPVPSTLLLLRCCLYTDSLVQCYV